MLRQRIKDRGSGNSVVKQSNDTLNKSVTLATTKNDEKKTLKCYYCDKLGHIKKNCHKFMNDKENGNVNDGDSKSKFVTGNAVLAIAKESTLFLLS